MNKSKRIDNILYALTFSLCSIAIIIVTLFFSQYSSFTDDDAWYSLIQNSIFEPLNPLSGYSAFAIHGGGYIPLWLTSFTNYYIPHFLGINPSDFFSVGTGLIKSVFLILIFANISNFSQLYKKSKYLFLFSYILVTIILCKITLNEMHTLIINHSFYRYLFPLLFFCLFWFYIFKLILNKEKQENFAKKISKVCLFSLCAFIIGTSNELGMYSSLMLSGLIILYNIILALISKIAKNTGLWTDNKFYLTKQFWFLIAILILSVIVYSLSPGFRGVAADRGMTNIHFVFGEFVEFLRLFFELYVKPVWLFWLIYGFTCIYSLFLAIKHKEIKEISLPYFLQISILSVILSLYLCGKTFYDGESFWLVHDNIRNFYFLFIYISFFILLSYIISRFEFVFFKNNIIKTVYCSIIIVILCLFLNSLFNNCCLLTYKTHKQALYITEKMTRFYYLKGQTIILPLEFYPKYPPERVNHVWSRNIAKDTQTPECSTDIMMTNMYYPKIYNDDKIEGFQICYESNAIEKFFNEGGLITKEEIENIKFERLKDDDFVLNKNLNEETIQKISQYYSR